MLRSKIRQHLLTGSSLSGVRNLSLLSFDDDEKEGEASHAVVLRVRLPDSVPLSVCLSVCASLCAPLCISLCASPCVPCASLCTLCVLSVCSLRSLCTLLAPCMLIFACFVRSTELLGLVFPCCNPRSSPPSSSLCVPRGPPPAQEDREQP